MMPSLCIAEAMNLPITKMTVLSIFVSYVSLHEHNIAVFEVGSQEAMCYIEAFSTSFCAFMSKLKLIFT